MAAIKIEQFGGEIPAVDDRLLPNNNATQSINTWLFSGRIEPVHSLVPIHTMATSGRSYFRLPKTNSDIDHMKDSWWLEFANQNVRVIRSPVFGQDDDGRYYWADGLYPKMMTGEMIMQANAFTRGAWSAATHYALNDGVTFGGNSYTALAANINQQPDLAPAFWIITPTPLKLGVPAPSVAPGVTSSGGVSTTNQSRAYVYTWVSALGEEGPPSPPTEHVGKIDDVWHITFTAPNTLESANRNLTHTRIYRTVTSTQGVATFFFVDEIPIATLTYDDSFTDAQVTDNEQLASTNWSEPPFDLQGLVTMPNGMVAGWRNNEVWFCEPYRPHAWPVQYVVAVEGIIVGLGAYYQTVVILTEGQPYAATGVQPGQMALTKLQPLEVCTSRNSIVSTPQGVLFSSPNGLINAGPNGLQNVTLQSILKDQWPEFLDLGSVAAAILAGGYYAFSISSGGVFQPDAFQNDAFQIANEQGTRPGIYISLTDARMGIEVLDPTPADTMNVITDIFNGEVTILRDGVVYQVDIRKQFPYGKYLWRSKIFSLPYLQNLGAAKVYWTPPFVDLLHPVLGDTYFRVYAGGHADMKDDGLPLRFSEKIKPTGEMYRLPSGYKAIYYQFEVEGYALINGIHVGQSARDLREV